MLTLADATLMGLRLRKERPVLEEPVRRGDEELRLEGDDRAKVAAEPI